ncbi:hypothetical protein SO802_008439 [Lithocarpus litseifolius]|uniref:RING-type E3 ubiquitin transferase n=1 Tax=Lithocarpus litseifolius TaxID=425828 RepID=A0AAW2D8L5_9ROSI
MSFFSSPFPYPPPPPLLNDVGTSTTTYDTSLTPPPPSLPHSSSSSMNPSILILVITVVVSVSLCLFLHHLNCRCIRHLSSSSTTTTTTLTSSAFKSQSQSHFEPNDQLRLLPLYCLAFHAECIDTWLESNQTCLLFRLATVASESNIMKSTGAGASDSIRLEIDKQNRSKIVFDWLLRVPSRRRLGDQRESRSLEKRIGQRRQQSFMDSSVTSIDAVRAELNSSL